LEAPNLSRHTHFEEYVCSNIIAESLRVVPLSLSLLFFSFSPSPDVRDWVICQHINIFLGSGPKKMLPKEFVISLPDLESH